jgi:N-acetylglucosamine-6-sulfatase
MVGEMVRWRRSSSFGLTAAAFLLPAVIGAVIGLPWRAARAVEPRPNIVMILTDDQRTDTLRYMPNVERLLGRHGVTFTNAYVVDPVCCPSRASTLTGLYPHSTGVYSNDPTDFNGGFPAFDDQSTIATWLHDGGYRTGLFGKYLNGYESAYVPPGWDRWFATHETGDYYDYQATSDGSIVQYGHAEGDYGTTVLADQAATFIEETPAEEPLFAYISVPAPHLPAIAAPSDRKAFAGLAPWRPPSFNEKDVSDKPTYLRKHPWMNGIHRQEIDATRLDQIRSLLAVDRLVGKVVDVLKETGRLDDTMIVFTSDNGMLWGEHRWTSKDVPYEESIGVPLLVRFDALGSTARKDPNLVLNVDLAPTFAEVAGLSPPATEGSSFLPLLSDPASVWRDGFLIEHMGSRTDGVPSYCAYHTRRYVLIRYSGIESELYDLKKDPLQMSSGDEDPSLDGVRSALNDQLVAACDPLPPSLTLNNG